MVHITYPILCMSYSYTYITFMLIYYSICYVLFSCTVIMYCYRVLSSCTIFTYCSHVLFIYWVHVLFYHINFSYHFTFLYIFIHHVRSYNLMLQNLSSHSSTMLLISHHIFPHVIFKSFILCFMPVNTKEVDKGNL